MFIFFFTVVVFKDKDVELVTTFEVGISRLIPQLDNNIIYSG